MTEKEKGLVNPWAKGSINLTMQAQILREDPKLAARLKAAAARAAEQAEAAKRAAPGPGPQLPKTIAALNGSKRKRQKAIWLPQKQ